MKIILILGGMLFINACSSNDEKAIETPIETPAVEEQIDSTATAPEVVTPVEDVIEEVIIPVEIVPPQEEIPEQNEEQLNEGEING